MTYPIYIFFGLAPSFIWLLFFLRKDAHPESNRMVLKIFFYGMLIAVAAALIEIGLFEIIFSPSESAFEKSSLLFLILYHFLGIALVEELLKYLVVRGRVLSNPEFDEPVDAMLYMIIIALGFAALENILVLLPKEQPLLFSETIALSSLRFVGATFLHALASGILGYFLALSLLETKKRLRLILSGLGAATLLHGFFNLSIISIEASLGFENGKVVIANYPLFTSSLIFVIALLLGSAFFVSFGFKKLKKLASVCKI